MLDYLCSAKLRRMKTILGTILLAGAVMVGCQQPQNANTNNNTTVVKEQAGPSNNTQGGIVYVNNDSLLKNFKLAIELREQLTDETIKLQTELANKEKKLYGEVEQLKRQARTLSQFETEQRQKKLINDEQALLQLQETYRMRLAKLEQDATLKVDEAIQNYLDRYCDDKPINMVLSYTQLGIIRWAREGHEITNEVLAGLNEEYDNEKKEEQKSE